MEEKFSLRLARPEDGPALAAIYRPYVLETAVSFEYTAPDGAEMTRRVETTLENYPWIVAEKAGQLLGYAYAGPFKGRPAYDWAVETSIYVAAEARGIGCGRALYQALEAQLKRQNILNMNACIAFTEGEDSRLSPASIRFHEKMGYVQNAHFHKCGYKFGKWYDMVWMEKHLGPHPEPALPMIPFGKI